MDLTESRLMAHVIFSRTALISNIDNITVFRDWDGKSDVFRIDDINEDFKRTFSGQDNSVNYLKAEEVKDSIIHNFNRRKIRDLLNDEIELITKRQISELFEHDGKKSVEKSFSVERVSEDFFRVGPLVYRGYETSGSERIQVSGKNLIDRRYNAFIQRFSMFKGESELNVFDNATALKDLVDKFSDIRKFDDLVEYTSSFEEKANSAYLKEMKSDRKVAGEAKALELQINRLA